MAKRRYALKRRTKSFRRRGPSPALLKAKKQMSALRTRYGAARRGASGAKAEFKTIGLTAGGGAIAGAINAMLPDGIAGFDAKIAIGLLGSAAGIMGSKQLGRKLAGPVCLLSAGVLAVSVAEFTENLLAGE